MINALNQIEKLLNEEISSINQKINGTIFLDILKQKLIEKIRKSNLNYEENNLNTFNKMFNYQDDTKKILTKLVYSKSKITYFNSILKQNLLFISLKENVSIILEDFQTKKKFSIKLLPLTGITISKDTKCTLNFESNSIILEINLEEKNLIVENSKETTI